MVTHVSVNQFCFPFGAQMNIQTRKWTPAFLDNMPLPGRNEPRIELTDPATEGLMLRATHRGIRWSVVYRVTGQGGFNPKTGRELKGPQQRMVIGKYPTVGLRSARDKADEIRSMADKGKDPKELQVASAHAKRTASVEAVKAAEREAQKRRKNMVSSVAEQLVAVKRMETRSTRNLEGALKNHILPKFGYEQLSDVTHAKINEMLNGYKAKGQFGNAREIKKHLRSLIKYGLQNGHMDVDPRGLIMELPAKNPNPQKIDRVLPAAQLKAIWKQAKYVAYPYGTLVQLLMLTGCRTFELERATWDEINFEKRALALSPNRSKVKEQELRPFTERAWAIIETLPRFNRGQFLFSTSGGEKPINSRTYMKNVINKGLPENFKDWSPHDLRHTFKTKLAELGVRPDISERCLGHMVQGIENTYNHHHYLDEKREAAELYSDFIGGLDD